MISLEHCRGLEYGGKAESLGKLIRAGFRVQPGIAFSWDARRYSSLEMFTELVRVIGSMKVTIHSKWAVRSSALGEDSEEHSFAGQHDSILNVECWELEQAVDKVRASAHNERSRIYRRIRGIHSGPKMGVVVQRMVPDVSMSAVVFTKDPITGSDDVVIEYTDGLGDKLVGGEVNPEQIVITRDALISCSHKYFSLYATALKVERLYTKPVDIEAAYNGEWWLCQSRPITT